MPQEQAGGTDDRERPVTLPMRATWIVLSVWVFTLVIIALVVVPLIFATCFPSPTPAP